MSALVDGYERAQMQKLLTYHSQRLKLFKPIFKPLKIEIA
jgi:hypothetical protein